jgi:hypothetical protein
MTRDIWRALLCALLFNVALALLLAIICRAW